MLVLAFVLHTFSTHVGTKSSQRQFAAISVRFFMLDDVRDHFLAFLRQSIGAPVEGTVARVLRNIEKLAAELLEDVVAPEWDAGALEAHNFIGAPYSPPKWDFTRISGSYGIGDLLYTIKRLDERRISNAGPLLEQVDVEKWYRAALVLRYCAAIRKQGLTQHNFQWLAQGVCRMPVSARSKEPELTERSTAVRPHSMDTETSEGELRTFNTKQATDMGVGHASAEPGRAQKQLTIEREARRVLIDGIARPVSAQPLKLLLLLAESKLGRKGPVSKFIIETETNRVPRELIYELRTALKGDQQDAAKICAWIEARRNVGYELVLAPEQIEIRQ